MLLSNAYLLDLMILTSVATVSPAAFAQNRAEPHKIDPSTIDCRGWTKRARISQTEMNTCAGRDTEVQRQILARLIAELRNKLASTEPTQWAQLEANQELWQDFVKRDCEWEAAFSAGGSIRPLAHAQCLTAATAQRVNRLRIMLCEGEGLTGECAESKTYGKGTGK
jgi:uncharacterized protein YecT (DUF1311 family)